MRFARVRDADGKLLWTQGLSCGMLGVLEAEPWINTKLTGRKVGMERLLAPVEAGNIFCIGLNYRRHAEETGVPLPKYPVIFMKPTSAVSGPGSPIRIPRCCPEPEVDYEGELAVVIGKGGRDIRLEDALSHVLGYTCAIDVSARKWQKDGGGGQWVRGKGFDTFCPLGPMLVTADEVGDPQQLTLVTKVNGKVMQESTTGDMIFSVAELISFLSQDTTLLPGTVILTGTPSGVGFVRKPAVFLKPGDVVAVTIESVGELVCPVTGSA